MKASPKQAAHLFECLLVLGSLVAMSPTQAAANCTVSAIGPAFGAYDPLNATATLANGSVLATCTWTGGGATTLSLVSSYSPGNSGSFPNRYMLSGTNRLDYNLYFNAAFTQIRGDGTGGSQTGGATLTVSSGSPTATASGVIYGRILPGLNAVPGSYLDTITVTITY
jgi:spore coat protein U-like protein